jgi:hypothetical protein
MCSTASHTFLRAAGALADPYTNPNATRSLHFAPAVCSCPRPPDQIAAVHLESL